jgi:hypothetical protein
VSKEDVVEIAALPSLEVGVKVGVFVSMLVVTAALSEHAALPPPMHNPLWHHR